MEDFKPFPTELNQQIDDKALPVLEHRNLYCKHYDECLNVAVKKDWRAWSCCQCPRVRCDDEKPHAELFARARRAE